jgi:hypothetical protein
MLEVSPRVSKFKIKVLLTLFISALTVLLTACPSVEIEPKPEFILSVDQPNLAGGGNITLKVEITKGKVTSVTFKTDKGAAIPPVTTPNSEGDFVATVAVTETTKFTAEVKGPGGTTTTPTDKAVTVTVTPGEMPKAPSSSTALKGFENMSLTVGTATGLTVITETIPGVTGNIVGDVKAETKNTSKGKVTIQGVADGLEFVYTPNAGATGADSFEYTVTNSGGTATGKIDITLAALSSAGFQLADSIDDINDTNKAIVFLTKDITCIKPTSENTIPCVTLDNNQSLIGLGSATVGGVTITNAGSSKPKIIASFSGTRRSGTAVCKTDSNGDPIPAPPGEFEPQPNCVESRVIQLADNTTVEGLEITSNTTDESKGYFIAIFGETDRNSNQGIDTLSGNITIKNVTINRSNGKPIYMKFGQGTNYGNYNLLIEGLDLNDANDTMVIGNPKTFVFRNSKVEMLQPVGISGGSGPQAFGDSAGILVQSYINSDVTLDDVDVFMQSTKYRIDFFPQNNNASHFEIASSQAGRTMNLTVKNCDLTYGPNGILDAGSRSIEVTGNAGTVNITGSTNNTSAQPASYSGTITGDPGRIAID